MTDNKTKMKDIPAQERPYEKCLALGPEALKDQELLSVILRSGTDTESVLELAEHILALGNGELSGLYHLTKSELMEIRGIGKVKAIQVLCIGELSKRISQQKAAPSLCFHDPQSVAEYYMEYMRHREQEIVLLLMLSTKGALLGESVISVGTVNASMVSPREIFLKALTNRAAGIILLHNHPSGDPSPSSEDIALTRQVYESGKMLGIELLDHIIIGDRRAVSFRSENLLRK